MIFPANSNKSTYGGSRNGKRINTGRKKIKSGILFCPSDPELVALKRKTHNLNVDYNMTYEDEFEKRETILREILGEMGDGVRIQGPIAFHYGKHTKMGKNVFANFNFTVQDDGDVTIGDNCVIGAGSVVTRDIPANSFAAGVPCRVIREITEADSMKYKPEILADNQIIGAEEC